MHRDRPLPQSQELYRIYLDNWDEIRKVDVELVHAIEGEPSDHQEALRLQYAKLQLPRHPKKSVQSALTAEVQGALIDGKRGVAYAKPDKVLKYMGLTWEMIQHGPATQRELQVVTGGPVYISACSGANSWAV